MKEQLFTLRFLFVFWLILISSINLFSQNKNENKNELWIGGSLNSYIPYHQNSTFETVEFNKNLTYRFQINNANPVNLGIGLRKISQNNWYQEYALSALNIQRESELVIIEIPNQNISEPINGRERTSINLMLRLEYGKLFKFKSIRKLSSGISLSLDPFLNYNSIEFNSSEGFPFSFYKLGTEISLIPSIDYEISEKLSLFIKIPIGINKFYFEHSKIENPFLSDEESKNSKFVNQFGVSHFQSSIGINYKI